MAKKIQERPLARTWGNPNSWGKLQKMIGKVKKTGRNGSPVEQLWGRRPPALEDDALLRMADAHHGLYRVGVQREPLVCLHHFDVQQFLAGNTEERKRERSCGHWLRGGAASRSIWILLGMSARLLGGEDEQKWPGWLGQEDCMGRWWALIVAQLGLGS
jgi:hypothetical protein